MIKTDLRSIAARRMIDLLAEFPPVKLPESYAAHLAMYGSAPPSRISWDLAAGECRTEYFDVMVTHQRRCISCGSLENDVQHD